LILDSVWLDCRKKQKAASLIGVAKWAQHLLVRFFCAGDRFDLKLAPKQCLLGQDRLSQI
jgi:hypothetical protein